MKQLFIIANWKSYKNTDEARVWLEDFTSGLKPQEDRIVVICPQFPHLSLLKLSFEKNNLPVAIGAQDVSEFDEGPYTGQVTARLLKDYVTYAVIGHSERRENIHESDEVLVKKVELARSSGITPIFCVQNADTQIPNGVDIVAYEPVFAIGSGTPDTPENAENIAKIIKEKSGAKHVLYGGSINAENIHSFTQMENISGVLVGSKSLDPNTFINIINNA